MPRCGRPRSPGSAAFGRLPSRWSELSIEPDLGSEFFEPTHRAPLVPREPEPEVRQSLEDRHRILAALDRATDDWMQVGRLVAEADDVEAAGPALAAHLGVDEVSARVVLDMQYRQLTKAHRRALRSELHRATRQLLDPHADPDADLGRT